MSENSAPTFIRPKNSTSHATVSVANTNRDGVTGSYTTVWTAGADGAEVEMVRAVAIGNTTAGVIRIWSNVGGTRRLVKEMLVTAITPGVATEVWTGEYIPDKRWRMPAGATVDVSTHIGESFHVHVNGGDF